jgi:uncharacterized protein
MADAMGQFVWYELMTTDADAAEEFYRSVIGWGVQDASRPEFRYTIFTAGEIPVGGLMDLPDAAREMGAGPGWMGYIAVDDVDARAAMVAEAGGKIHRSPDDIPEVGRFAVVADPQGAAFVLFKSLMDQPVPSAPLGTPGHGGWRELHAADWEPAFAFYSGLLGWTKAEAMDMGPMGVYQLFARGAEPIGGMMTKQDAVPHPFWLFYFNVEGTTEAAGRVEAAGGRVLNGPMEVPGGMWILHCIDPQGAMFALVAARR